MAPSPFTEDYYLIVGVAQDADKELIVKSYRKRARELHLDCNQGTREATEAFQRELDAQWRTTKINFEWSIFEVNRDIERLEKDIMGLVSIAAVEAAEEAQRNSWTTLFLSFIQKKKVEDSEEVKEQKDRERQERRIETDMKERRLQATKAALADKEEQLRIKQANYEVTRMKDQQAITQIQLVMWQRGSAKAREGGTREG
ncbi:uncharacterized protein CC84DRAFT_1180699 [Paraphaeosphaeria sporulosa]|uniref:J domain-containing protein n=1 Tax=Paraphaeosphaeria sporulosa TaxID=1460663 RepID=A0A177C1H6_9PLEO|nr:uncharacterized protein CC84DRAFT_1180699 [Paraphaeosphaeria sporulosa]OAG00729.1 hypothetical protein CC84DRAFT_1180699 [Paraphaeosphaeria sporulosa]